MNCDCGDLLEHVNVHVHNLIKEMLKAMKEDHIPGFCYTCSSSIIKPCKRLELIAKVEEFLKP